MREFDNQTSIFRLPNHNKGSAQSPFFGMVRCGNRRTRNRRKFTWILITVDRLKDKFSL